MKTAEMLIRPFTADIEDAVVTLWQRAGLIGAWNNPHADIQRKLKVNLELFLVGLIDGKMIATAMAGYEGHRGWVNYLAVNPDCRRRGLGRQMMAAAEKSLLERGCPKINIQVRAGNTEALGFYRALGFKMDEAISMGKRLIEDEATK